MGGTSCFHELSEAVYYCDYVLLGEGDETIISFITALRNNQPIDFPGAAYKEGAGVIFTGHQKPPLTIHFSVQARFEVGFDDEMPELLKKAGFLEIAMGIEFLEDEAFASNNRKSSYSEIIRSVENIQKHGLFFRGLFIMGADNYIGEYFWQKSVRANLRKELIHLKSIG